MKRITLTSNKNKIVSYPPQTDELSLELEEESMIIPHIRVYAWVWDVMRHFKQYLAQVLCLSYFCPEIY